jgi:hypothetical protein
MHREVLRLHGVCIEGLKVDHKDGNSLDNRLSNLRVATDMQSAANRRMRKDNQTGYKGVYRRNNKFISQVRFNGVIVHTSRFITAKQAAHDYDHFARFYYGEFATLNFPKEGEQSAIY